jgi:hypothetical protein
MGDAPDEAGVGNRQMVPDTDEAIGEIDSGLLSQLSSAQQHSESAAQTWMNTAPVPYESAGSTSSVYQDVRTFTTYSQGVGDAGAGGDSVGHV